MKFCADFETTTDPGDCRVWAYGIAAIDDPTNFIYGNSLDDFILWLRFQKVATVYFHNLKFDGEFILHWLLTNGFKFVDDKRDMTANTFTTLISDKGQFYSIEICFDVIKNRKEVITIYDSLKILPFSVKQIAKGFNLQESKLKIDYREYREPGHELTQHEIDYLKNDVVIVAKALKTLFDQQLNQMTQGSNALHDFKKIITPKNFARWFPTPQYDADIRQSYKGGFTYLSPAYKNTDLGQGIVLDVNSLYPSVMYYNPLPYGEGIYFRGKYKEDSLYNLYIQMFTCQFKLKEKYIPTIQIKHSLSFIQTEYLTSSNGEDVTLCLTNIDLELFLEHYEVFNMVYHSGWKFRSYTGIFTDYIDKWVAIKNESTLNGNEAMRTLAKLMLNALYGKFALNPNVQGKMPYLDENGIVKYRLLPPETREPIYIPVGTFITSWARYKTITSAQSVFDRFIYADTDSLHLVGTELPENLEVDKVKLGAWKHEGTFNRARYLRQKSYMEEMIVDRKKYVKYKWENKNLRHLANYTNNQYLITNITCAGMPESCYKYVNWDNFKEESKFDGKLQMLHVPGGIVLKDIAFTIKS